MAQESRTKVTLVLDVEGKEAQRVLEAVGREGFEAAERAGREFRELDRDLRKLGSRGERSAKQLGQAWRKLGGWLKGSLLPTLGLMLAAFVGFSAMRTVTVNAQQFQLAMGEVATILPDAAGGMAELSDEVRRLAIAQGENEQVVAKGLYQTISAGITEASDALEVLGIAGKLAVVGVAQTNETVDLLTTAINAFSLETSEAGRLADVFFETVRTGKTTISELASSISVALPGANALGISVEDVAAGLAALTQQGYNTSEASTRLSSLWKSLLTRGEELDKLFRERLGESYDINTVKAEGLQVVLEKLRGALLDDSEALEVLGARQESFQALMGLTGDKAKLFTGTLEATNNALGKMGERLDLIAGTDAFRVQQAVQAMRDGFLELGDAILRAVADAIDQLGGIDALNQRFKNLASILAPLMEAVIGMAADMAAGFTDVGGTIEETALRAELLAHELRGVLEATRDLLNLGGKVDQADMLRRVMSGGASGVRGDFNPQGELAQQFPSVFDMLQEAEAARQRMVQADNMAAVGRGPGSTAAMRKEFQELRDGYQMLAEVRLKDLNQLDAARQAAHQAELRDIAEKRERLAELELERINRNRRGGAGMPARGSPAAAAGVPPFLAPNAPPGPELLMGPPAPAIEQMVAQSTEQLMALQDAMLSLRAVAAQTDAERLALLDDQLIGEQRKLELLLDQVDATKEQRTLARLAFDDAAAAQRVGMADQQKQQAEQTIKATDAWKEFTKQQQFVRSAVDGTAQSMAYGMEDALVGIINGTVSAGEAFKQFVSSMVVDLIRLAIRLTITNWLLTFFSGLTGNVGQVSMAAFMASSFVSGLGQASLAANQMQTAANGAVWGGGFQAFAQGGIVSQPTLGLVGEGSMNEAIIPMPNGRQVPVDLKGGGNQVNLTVQLSAIDTQTGAQFLMANVGTIGRMLVDQMEDNRSTRLAVRRAAGTRGLMS